MNAHAALTSMTGGRIDGDWTAKASCSSLPHLPWTRDEVDIAAWDALTMTVVCDNCFVREDCEAAVRSWGITGCWWAGRDRDPQANVPLLVPDWLLHTAPDDTGWHDLGGAA